MTTILCPRCIGDGTYDGTCHHCGGAGRVNVPDLSSENDQAVLAVVETLRPRLVADLFTDSVISKMGCEESSHFDGTMREWWLVDALQCVLLGITESAWEAIEEAGMADDTLNLKESGRPSRRGRKSRTLKAVHCGTGQIYRADYY